MKTLAAARVIDVRELEGPDHCQAVLGAFDLLAAGEALVVASQHAPAKLLRHLQADRKGEFEWSPLETGPGRFRTEIRRRDAKRPALRTVKEALAWDHDRISGMPPGAGPTEVMRMEHLRIGKRLEAIGSVLHGRGAPLPLRTQLHQVLGEHNEKEELVLYPMTDQSLGAAESDALVARIQAS